MGSRSEPCNHVGAHQRNLLRFVWPSARSDSERIVRWLGGRRWPRTCLNWIYSQFSYRQKGEFHARFAKLFRSHDARVENGNWTVVFHGRKISVPLRQQTIWLDWDSALSLLGHEVEIKATYEALLDASAHPCCVFDVGANYGLHSLLFLSHGIQVVSFEPNPVCREYFERLEELNDVQFTVESMALSSTEGVVELCYPETDTWLGTTDPERARKISSKYQLRRTEVPCMTLDGYVQRSGKIPDLIKLDTEGNELQILLGAKRTLETARPMLVFECWRNNKRDQLWDMLDGMGYEVVGLPLISLDEAIPIDLPGFSNSEASNFAGLPRERLGM